MISFKTTSSVSYFILSSFISFYLVNGLIDAPAGKDAVEEKVLTSGQVIIRKSMTQAEARVACETRGSGEGRLAVLLKPEHATALIEAVKKESVPYTNDVGERGQEFGLSRRYWIGLTDVAIEGEWVWMKDGSTLQYGNMWYPGQPDHGTKAAKNEMTEHCVVLWNPIFREKSESHTFNDEPCLNKHYAICDEKSA